MKIDVTKIPGYKEGMTAEDQLKLITEYDIDMSGYTKKDVADKYASEAADWKKKYNATLTEQERKENEASEKFSSMEKELTELRRERTVSKYTADYIALGFDKQLASETAQALADGKTDVVFENMNKHQSALKANLKKELLMETPAPGAGKPNSGPDYEKMAQEAFARGDSSAGAYYTRIAQSNTDK